MSDTKSTKDIEFDLSPEGKLRHENQYLKERLVNLEVFKQNFFAQHHDLIKANETIAQLEQQLNLDKIKDQILNESASTGGEAENTSELLDFFQDCLTAASYHDLVMSIFQSADRMVGNTVIQIHDDHNTYDYAMDDSIKEVGTKLINQHKKKGEPVHIEGNTILNYKHISIIYTNLSGQSPEVIQRANEYIEIVTLGANTRLSTIKQREELEHLRKNIYLIFKKTNKSFETLQNQFEDNTISISEIYEKCRSSIIENIERMGLAESNESLIKLILDDSRNDLLLTLTTSMSLDEEFMGAMKRLEEAYAREYSSDAAQLI